MTPGFSGENHMESHMPQGTVEPAAPILRLREVEALTGRKRSSIYEDIAAGRIRRSRRR